MEKGEGRRQGGKPGTGTACRGSAQEAPIGERKLHLRGFWPWDFWRGTPDPGASQEEGVSREKPQFPCASRGASREKRQYPWREHGAREAPIERSTNAFTILLRKSGNQ